jgi:hypothetical protein
MKQQLSIQGFFSQFVTSTLKGGGEKKSEKENFPSQEMRLIFFPSHGKAKKKRNCFLKSNKNVPMSLNEGSR